MIARCGLRAGLLVFAFFALYFSMNSGSQAGFIQQQRAQQAVNITINVAPGPYGYAPSSGSAIALARRLGRGSAMEPQIIAQATQRSVPVEANVTPNPLATAFAIVPSSVGIGAQAGGPPVTITCAYTVKVQTTVTSWTVDEGLSNDFSASFNGNNLANNSYLSTPHPSPTPFVVYPDNNNAWTIMDKNTLTKTYCVDLTITVPVTVLSGAYQTNAIYTLFY
ncbi:MAG: hypothetical protein ABR584_03925 [Candidatus Baltobacteraceae bacterium]